MILKRTHYFFILVSLLFGAENNYFKYKIEIEETLRRYIGHVDNKNIEKMISHLTMPVDFHFGSSSVVTVRSNAELKSIFNKWKDSDNSKFNSTIIKELNIYPTGLVKNYLATADVVYERLNTNGEVLRTERVLYHFIYGDAFVAGPIKFVWSYLTRWTSEWKIYMISNIEI